MNEREAIRQYVMRIAGGRPVRWADERTTLGDFAGREWTLELFDVTRQERRRLRDELWELQKRIWDHMGHSLLLIFHTPGDTERYYPWVRGQELPLVDTTVPSVVRLRRSPSTGPRHTDRRLVPVPRAA